MRVSPKHDTGIRPGLTKQSHNPFDNGLILFARWPFAWTKNCCDQLSGQSFKKEQWQIAVVVIIGVEKRQLLLAMCDVFGVIHVQDDDLRLLAVTGNESLDKTLRQSVDVFPSHAGFQPGKSWAGSQLIPHR